MVTELIGRGSSQRTRRELIPSEPFPEVQAIGLLARVVRKVMIATMAGIGAVVVVKHLLGQQ
jgi:hypothetical protein